MKLKVLCLVFTLILILSGCSKEQNQNPYVIPDNYTGEALMKVYTKNSENAYKLDIICRDDNYSVRSSTKDITWNLAFLSGNRCVMSSDKFPESSVAIDNFKLADSFIYDFDLSKFNKSAELFADELVYFDGTYKHVLNFNKESLLPSTIFIYKNDDLVKTITYEKLNPEE